MIECHSYHSTGNKRMKIGQNRHFWAFSDEVLFKTPVGECTIFGIQGHKWFYMSQNRLILTKKTRHLEFDDFRVLVPPPNTCTHNQLRMREMFTRMGAPTSMVSFGAQLLWSTHLNFFVCYLKVVIFRSRKTRWRLITQQRQYVYFFIKSISGKKLFVEIWLPMYLLIFIRIASIINKYFERVGCLFHVLFL